MSRAAPSPSQSLRWRFFSLLFWSLGLGLSLRPILVLCRKSLGLFCVCFWLRHIFVLCWTFLKLFLGRFRIRQHFRFFTPNGFEIGSERLRIFFFVCFGFSHDCGNQNVIIVVQWHKLCFKTWTFVFNLCCGLRLIHKILDRMVLLSATTGNWAFVIDRV